MEAKRKANSPTEKIAMFMANGAVSWYREITKQDVATPTTNMMLVTTEAAGLCPAVKHTKGAPGNESPLVARIDTPKNGKKNPA